MYARSMSNTRSTRPSRWSVGAALIGAGVALTACSGGGIPPEEKEAINLGTNAEIGSVVVSNLLIVTRGESESARLIGVLLNESDAAAEVTLSDADDQVVVDLQPGQQYAFHEHPALFTTADDAPGAVTSITVTVGERGSESLTVPVRDGTLEWLKPYLP